MRKYFIRIEFQIALQPNRHEFHIKSNKLEYASNIPPNIFTSEYSS